MTKIKSIEKKQQLIYKALDFRVNSLCSKTFKIWHQKALLQRKLNIVDKKMTKLVLGFPFYILQRNSLNPNDAHLSHFPLSNPQLHYEYQAENIKSKLIKILRKKSLFNAWKNTAISKRIDFPYDFYTRHLLSTALRSFKLSLRSKLIEQRNSIKVDILRSKREERVKGRVFLAMLQNVFKRKKQRWMLQTVERFRRDVLLKKALKAWME